MFVHKIWLQLLLINVICSYESYHNRFYNLRYDNRRQLVRNINYTRTSTDRNIYHLHTHSVGWSNNNFFLVLDICVTSFLWQLFNKSYISLFDISYIIILYDTVVTCEKCNKYIRYFSKCQKIILDFSNTGYSYV